MNKDQSGHQANKKVIRQILYAAGIVATLALIFALVIRITRGPNSPSTSYRATDVALVPKKVEEKYLQAAQSILEKITTDQAFSDLESTLAYTWAHHQYYLATESLTDLEAAIAGIDHAATLMQADTTASHATDETVMEPYSFDPDKIGLFCAMYQDIYQDTTIASTVRSQARKLCDQAADNFWETPALAELHQRFERGQSQMDTQDSALFTYTPDYIIQEVTTKLRDSLKKYKTSGKFSWYDTDVTPLDAINNMNRHLAATSNKYYRRQIYHQVDPSSESSTAVATRLQNQRDQLDWLYLLGQTLSWYASYGASGETNRCLLTQNLTTFLHSSSAGDLSDGEILAYASLLAGTQTPACQTLAYYNYRPSTDTFDRESNLISAQLVDEYTPVVNQLYLAGLLSQEEAPTADPLARLGTNVDISLPEGFEHIYDELTPEDLASVPQLSDYAPDDSSLAVELTDDEQAEQILQEAREYYNVIQEESP